MGHIELSRAADLIVVAPATTDLMAKMANGIANDLASTLLMATDKRVLIAPAMNVRMWLHPANQRNLATLEADGILRVGPDEGDMACGEYGPGRMAEPMAIVEAVGDALAGGPLAGQHILVTSGPTHEPIDPVRYIANRSSGAQGTAIARALSALGADVTFITGPADVPPPAGVQVIKRANRPRNARCRAIGACPPRLPSSPPPWPTGASTSVVRLEDQEGCEGQAAKARFCREPRHPRHCRRDEEGPP